MANFEERASKRQKPDYNDTITVLVGSDEEAIIVHKATIQQDSAFFTAACSARWIKDQKAVIKLPTVEQATFTAYIHWAYTRTLDLSGVSEPETEHAKANVTHKVTTPTYLSLGKLWIFANFVNNDKLYNAVIDRMLQKAVATPGHCITAPSLKHIWDESPPGSTIRRLCFDLVAAGASQTWLERNNEDVPREVLLELAIKYAGFETKSFVGPQVKDGCRYHVHEAGVERCEEMSGKD